MERIQLSGTTTNHSLKAQIQILNQLTAKTIVRMVVMMAAKAVMVMTVLMKIYEMTQHMNYPIAMQAIGFMAGRKKMQSQPWISTVRLMIC